MAQNSLLDFLQGASNAAASNISAPVDGIAWLLRKAGIPVPDAPIGGSDWMARKGLTVQPQNQLAGLLGESVGGVAPIVAAAKAPQIAKGLLQVEANASSPSTLPGFARDQRGMLRLPAGRIPETLDETYRLAKQVRQKAEKLGYKVEHDGSNISASQYVTFPMTSADGMEALPSLQLRISNHKDFHPLADGIGKRYSVDPSSMQTYEEALGWLKENGVNLFKRPPKSKFPDDALIAKIWGGPIETAPPAWVESMRKRPINQL